MYIILGGSSVEGGDTFPLEDQWPSGPLWTDCLPIWRKDASFLRSSGICVGCRPMEMPPQAGQSGSVVPCN